MVYIITQTKGHLADAAQEMRAACRNSDEVRARALLAKFRPDLDNTNDFFWTNPDGKIEVDCWWMFCAASAISQKIELKESKLDKIYDWCIKHNHLYDGRAERWIVAELKKKFKGCEWDVSYEY